MAHKVYKKSRVSVGGVYLFTVYHDIANFTELLSKWANNRKIRTDKNLVDFMRKAAPDNTCMTEEHYQKYFQ